MNALVELFCHVDDFVREVKPMIHQQLIAHQAKKRMRATRLSDSEIFTIMIHFHQSHYRDFKAYYIRYVSNQLRSEFPNLISYTRFVARIPTILIYLCLFIHSQVTQATGIYFIDATMIKACHVKRASQNKVFQAIAKKSKSTMGWVYGLKLHILINDKGELLAFRITKANVDDRKVVQPMAQGLTGKLFGDKGYISAQLFDTLCQNGLQLIAPIKKNMKNKLMPIMDKILLRKRAIVESIIDQLKNIVTIQPNRLCIEQDSLIFDSAL